METLCSLMDILGKIKPLVDTLTLIFVIIYVWKTWHIASATKESAKATEKSADISRQTLAEMSERLKKEYHRESFFMAFMYQLLYSVRNNR